MFLFQEAAAGFGGQVEAGEVGIAFFEKIDDAQGMEVVFKAAE